MKLFRRFGNCHLRFICNLLFVIWNFFFLLPSPAIGEDTPWRLLSERDGISVYVQEVSTGRLMAFKGESLLDIPPAKVATLLDEVGSQPQWVPYLIEAKHIKYLSFHERWVYSCSNAPWPLQDRDFFTHSVVEVNKKIKKITVHMRSEEGPASLARNDRIRVDMDRLAMVLESRDGGAKTHFSMEVRVDPKGWVPDWVVNLVQSRWPRKYIEGLRRQAAKPEIKNHPMIKELFGE